MNNCSLAGYMLEEHGWTCLHWNTGLYWNSMCVVCGWTRCVYFNTGLRIRTCCVWMDTVCVFEYWSTYTYVLRVDGTRCVYLNIGLCMCVVCGWTRCLY